MSDNPFYVCPKTHVPLSMVDQDGCEVTALQSPEGQRYPVVDGIVDLAWPRTLSVPEQHTVEFYDGRVDAYDMYLPLTFHTHNEDEESLRRMFISKLQAERGDRILDLACGTGRDSELIANVLGEEGELFMADIAPGMLRRCQERMTSVQLKTKQFAIASASYLPFPDKFFDGVYSFGGLGEFPDIRQSLAEMVRVTKVGGRIVVGDESIPIWLRETEFAKILATTNPQFMANLPLAEMPIEARDVVLQWVIGGVFYLIDFRVAEGEPQANFDFEIPGQRGGTYRTRYEGQLEGVTPEAKHLAMEAQKMSGLSMHKWLDEVVRNAAMEQLNVERSECKGYSYAD